VATRTAVLLARDPVSLCTDRLLDALSRGRIGFWEGETDPAAAADRETQRSRTRERIVLVHRAAARRRLRALGGRRLA